MLSVALLCILLSSQHESIMSTDEQIASIACEDLMQGSLEPLEIVDLLSKDHVAFFEECPGSSSSSQFVVLEDLDLSIPENQLFLLHSPPSIADVAVSRVVSSNGLLSSRYSDRDTCSTYINNGARADFFDDLSQAIIERWGDDKLAELFTTYDVNFISLEHRYGDHPLVAGQMNPGTFYCHAGEACTLYAIKVEETADEAEAICGKNKVSPAAPKKKRQVPGP